MSELRISPPQIFPGFLPRLVVLSAIALVMGAAAMLVAAPIPRVLLLSGAITLLVMVTLLAAMHTWSRFRFARTDAQVRALFGSDSDPAILTDRDGRVLWRNSSAAVGLGLDEGMSVGAVLDVAAAKETPMEALCGTAISDGLAEAQSGDGPVKVARVATGRLVWRIAKSARSSDAVADMVDLSLRADDDGHILWMSPALLDAFDTPPTDLSQVIDDMPVRDGHVHALLIPRAPPSARIRRQAVGDRLVEIRIRPEDTDDTDEGQFEALPVPLLELDRTGTVRKSNRMARSLLSFKPSEDVTFPGLVEGLGRQVGDWLAEGFEGRLRGRPEVVRASRAGNDLFIQVTLQRAIDNAPDRIIAVLNDATELKTLEAQFVQSQKMQAIGQLAGGVAHDFNNLLTAISGHCDLLLLRHEPSDQDFADLEQIAQNANRAASLVGQLLAFSRKQNLSPEHLDLRDILADLTHLLNRLVGERVALTFRHDPGLKMVRADKRQLEQVIMNLVVNARDAMPDGGDIRITTRMLELDAPDRRDRVEVPAGEYVLVEVLDQGVGIAQDKLQKIFEPFFTTKKTGEGTGLGLSTAYGIVKQTGGYIFARSQPGEGTTFSLYFPAIERPRAVPQAAPVEHHDLSSQRQGRILLVEDEAPVRAFAARALRMRGYDVVEAENGETALEIASDPDGDFDVFVTDVIMPGLDGPGWVREALRSRPGTRVIFVSGYAEESFAENQAAIPHSRFLPKPFSLKALTQAVDAEIV